MRKIFLVAAVVLLSSGIALAAGKVDNKKAQQPVPAVAGKVSGTAIASQQDKETLVANIANMRNQELRVAVLGQMLNEEIAKLRQVQEAFCSKYKLDVENPVTLGPLVDPEYYLEARYALNETHKEVLALIPKLTAEFAKVFGRTYNGLIEGYQIKDAERVIVAMGSVCGTIREVVDELRAKGKKVGLLKVTSLRPFPASSIYEALKHVPKVAVIDRALSLGSCAPLASEIRATFFGKLKKPKTISSFVVGLGGRDITRDSIEEIFRLTSTKEKQGEFIDLKPELLKESYG